MSYAAPAPVAPAAPGRPATVRLATALLVLMGAVGLGYAIATVAVAPGVVDRFRGAAAGADGSKVDGYATVLWVGAALGAVLAVILFALFVVLALGLRRGSHAARIGTWVVCGLGLLFGCGTVATVAVQRAGEGTPGTLGFALSEAYPGPWIGLNIGLSVAQMVGYAVVAVLLIAAPGTFFGRTGVAATGAGALGGAPPVHPPGAGAYVTLPTYGSANTYPPSSYPQTTGTSQPPSAPPEPGPDDDYWARPSS
jgi:hypothetical protein